MKTILVSLALFVFGIFCATISYSTCLNRYGDENCESNLNYYLSQYFHIAADIIIYPKVLDLKSKRRTIISGISLHDGYDPHDIDGDSIELSVQPCMVCKIIYPDCGYPSHGRYISVFPRPGLIDDIETVDLEFPTKLELKITGELMDGTPFEGFDIIWVVK